MRDVSDEGNPRFSPGPPDETWRRNVSALPPEHQAAAISAKLKELNPGFEGVLRVVQVEQGKIVELRLTTPAVFEQTPPAISDLRPLQVLTALRAFRYSGNQYVPGRLTDLSPLGGLPLEELHVSDNPSLEDLRPLRGMKLRSLDISGTSVASLQDLDGSELVSLDISNTPIRDLSPLEKMPKLQTFSCYYCVIESLEPLLATDIRQLNFTFRPERDQAVLQKLTNLETINNRTVQSFLQPQRGESKLQPQRATP